MDLSGKTFIVTGASAGIGRAVALELARCGSHLVLNARSVKPLAQTSAQCERFGVRAFYVAGDGALAATAERMVAEALNVGSFYGILHIAGVAHPGPFLWELPESHFSEVMGASLTAGYQLARFAFPVLLAQGEGVAVFVGSGAAEIAMPGLAAYCVAKAAEEHLVRQLAAEAPSLTTFVYRPGTVDTRMQKGAREAQGGAAASIRREFRSYKDLGVLITPEQAAGYLITILRSDARRFHGKICSWGEEE